MEGIQPRARIKQCPQNMLFNYIGRMFYSIEGHKKIGP